MVFVDILLSFCIQIASTVGAIILFGFLIALCNKGFYANFGSKQMTVCYVTGCIGTPIHECAHALFCLIFAHKITKIKLFQINSDDGTLGYVQHTYNSKNVYQNVGNFFIGVAPVTVISALLYLLAYLILPATLSDLLLLAKNSVSAQSLGDFLGTTGLILYTFFAAATTWQWWVFVAIGMFLAPHMTLSGADIKGAFSGLFVLLVVVFAVDIILGIIGSGVLQSFTGVIFSVGAVLDVFLLLALMISVVAYLLSLVYRVTLGCRSG